MTVYSAPGTPDSKVTFKPRYENWIGGEWVKPVKGQYFEDISPVTGKAFAEVARGTAEDIELALDAAHKAAPAWGKTSSTARAAVLNKIADIMDANLELLAVAETWDNGKPVRETLNADIPLAADHFRYFASAIRSQDGDHAELDGDMVSYQFHEPLGVVGQIIPWNFPILMAIWKLAPALAAGNAVVLKPAEQTPWSGALIGEIAQDAGLPDGLLNVIHGDGRTGALLLDAPVDGVAFTGSAAVGHAIARRLHETPPLRPLILEMGGKNPTFVTASADLDRAAEGIVRAAFGLSGQKCSACSRVVVAREVHDELVALLVERTRALALGDPADPATFLGPVIDVEAVERYDAAVAQARRDGRIAIGGAHGDPAGCYVAPTIVCDLPRGHRLTREETFLPFVTVTAVDGFEDALTEANAVDYGLTAGIFTQSEPEQEEFLARAEAGVLYVNRREGATTGAWPGVQAFCGWKCSGASGKGGLGPHYLLQFMREQSHTIMD